MAGVAITGDVSASQDSAPISVLIELLGPVERVESPPSRASRVRVIESEHGNGGRDEGGWADHDEMGHYLPTANERETHWPGGWPWTKLAACWPALGSSSSSRS